MPTPTPEIMVTLTLIDGADLLDIRQQPRRFLPLDAAAHLAAVLRRGSPNAYAVMLASALETAVADACAITGDRAAA